MKLVYHESTPGGASLCFQGRLLHMIDIHRQICAVHISESSIVPISLIMSGSPSRPKCLNLESNPNIRLYIVCI